MELMKSNFAKADETIAQFYWNLILASSQLE